MSAKSNNKDEEPKESKDEETQIVCSGDSYKLAVAITLQSESGISLAEIKTDATIPFLLMEEHLLVAEPRVRQQLDSLVTAFKLLCASKLNNLIETTKGNTSQIVQNSGHQTEEPDEFPEVDDPDEI